MKAYAIPRPATAFSLSVNGREIPQIISNPEKMTVTVGNAVFARPQLIRRAEWDITIKQQVIASEEPPHSKGQKAIHKFYCARLGPKFNRRFQAANYWLWVGNRMTPTTGNMLRHSGQHWYQYNDHLVEAAHQVLPHINQAERDGLYHLIPAIITFGGCPHDIRGTVGGAAWRRIASNTRTRNARIMQAALSTNLPAEDKRSRFLRLLDVPSGLLGCMVAVDDEELMAARIAPRKRREEFTQAHHLVVDAGRMLGRINPEWSYIRLRREHDRAARDYQRGRFSDKPFAEPWHFSGDAFTATRLVSPLDIATEGVTQHHCIASYAREAARERYAVVRIDGNERATAGYRSQNGAWHLDQVYAACNGSVSNECRAFAATVARQLPHEQRAAA